MRAWMSALKAAPADPIFGLLARYRADPSPEKIDLSLGAYRGDDGKNYVLPVVREVEIAMAADATLDHEYLPIDGLPAFNAAVTDLVLGPLDSSPARKEGRCFAFQSLSGTGALRVAADLIAKGLPGTTPVYLSDPTWVNHAGVMSAAGFSDIRRYRYFEPTSCLVDGAAFLADLRAAPDGAVVVLHTCAHNPTGADPSEELWGEVAAVCGEKQFTVVLDSAYLGYATGDVDRDAAAIRRFDTTGVPFFAAVSFAKNFGLYSERTGCLLAACPSPDAAAALLSHAKVVARQAYSNPPAHGARVVARVLGTPALKAKWLEQVGTMAGRIRDMRRALTAELRRLGTPGEWGHIEKQIGMFCYLGVSPAVCAVMTEKHKVYLQSSGRISVAGLCSSNVARVAAAIHDGILSTSAPAAAPPS